MTSEERVTGGADEGLIPCACPRCGSKDTRVVLRSPDRQFQFPRLFCVSKCIACGLLHQNPRIPLENLAQHYPGDYSPYASGEMEIDDPVICHLKHQQGYSHLDCNLRPTSQQQRYGRAAAQYHLIPDFKPSGRVLEFGCAAGNRLALFKRLGWSSCLGSEYSDAAAIKARERGLDVITGPVETALEKFEAGSLDAIVAGFVIEHLTDPFATTRALAAKLKSGGQFLFSTINIGSPDFWLYGTHWYDLDLPRHMVFFRKQDLRAMLSQDFVIERILVESALNDYLGSAKYRKRDGVGGWRKWLDSTLLFLGNRLARPLRCLARVGLGARIYVIARKK